MGLVAPGLSAAATAKGAAFRLFSVIDRVPVIDSASTEGQQLKDLKGDIVFDVRSNIKNTIVFCVFCFDFIFPAANQYLWQGYCDVWIIFISFNCHTQNVEFAYPTRTDSPRRKSISWQRYCDIWIMLFLLIVTDPEC